MAKISVIIPLYNRQELIAETLASIETQSLKSLEVLVVDDNSTDDSVEAVEKFSSRSQLPIRIIRNFKKKGKSGALNCGVSQAAGDWIAFQDSDDLWTPNHLQQLSGALEKFPQVHVGFSGFEFFGEAKDVEHIKDLFEKGVQQCLSQAFEQVYPNIWLSNRQLFSVILEGGFPFRWPTLMVRKNFLFTHSLMFDEDLTYTEDAQFVTFAAYLSPFVYISHIGAKIRRHKENEGDLGYGDQIIQSYQIRIRKLQEYFQNQNLTPQEKKSLQKRITNLQEYILLAGSRNANFGRRLKAGLKLCKAAPSLSSVRQAIKALLFHS